MKITNNSGIPLALAVWCVHDEYDYVNEPNYISITTLMKPLRQIVLGKRIPMEQRTSDVEEYISRALGHSLHDSIEKSWVKGYRQNLKKLGYPESVIDRVKINPVSVSEGDIPIYLEQRNVVSFKGYRIGGKYDLVAEGIVHDNKSTTAYTWVYANKDDDYQLQGSLYRWLNPDKITEDFIRINFIFTDWQRAQAKQNPAYPQKRLEFKDVPLMSLEETEQWVSKKLDLIARFKDAPEREIPECTDEELWRSDPVYKYFADPAKVGGRSTKNFNSLLEATEFKMSKGNVGVVVTVPGEVKRCQYCDAFELCTQRLKYSND